MCNHPSANISQKEREKNMNSNSNNINPSNNRKEYKVFNYRLYKAKITIPFPI
jgi:hypothetical protein